VDALLEVHKNADADAINHGFKDEASFVVSLDRRRHRHHRPNSNEPNHTRHTGVRRRREWSNGHIGEQSMNSLPSMRMLFRGGMTSWQKKATLRCWTFGAASKYWQDDYYFKYIKDKDVIRPFTAPSCRNTHSSGICLP
jgi:hypothetical protein